MHSALEQHQGTLREGPSRPIRLGWVSTWNTKCGIAEYSRSLLRPLDGGGSQLDVTILASRNDILLGPDESRVIRCWSNSNGEITTLLNVIQQQHFELLVIQFSFAFQSLEHLEAIIALCNVVGTRVVLICHAIHGSWLADEIVPLTRIAKSLQSVSCILVHSENDVEELNAAGLQKNVSIFPHGYPDASPLDQRAARASNHLPQDATIIGSYGFLLPNKGIDKLVEAIGQLRHSGHAVKLLLVNAVYSNPVSAELLAKIKQLIEVLGLGDDVILKTEFLPNDISLSLLAACDVLVFPYQNTTESSSAAVRIGLASGRPVLCSPLSIFSDVANVVKMLPGEQVQDICSGLEQFLSSDAQSRSELAGPQAGWVQRYGWPNVARLLREKLDGLPIPKIEPSISDGIAEYLIKLQRHNEQLERLATDLQRTNRVLQHREKVLRDRLLSTRDQLQSARDEVQLIYQSTSWRLTRPLRQMRTALSAFRSALAARSFGAIRLFGRTIAPLVDDKFRMIKLSRREEIILKDLMRGSTRTTSAHRH